jgi:hypothetical protein
MKILYTDAALRELVEFQQRQKALLEELVSDRKHVFGDDILEITASDIKDAAHRIQPIRPTARRYQSSELLTRAYVAMGVAMMVGAFFYRQIQEIIETNRTQALIFFTGASITAIGWLFGYWLKLRQRRYSEQVDKLHFLESAQSRTLEERDDETPSNKI